MSQSRQPIPLPRVLSRAELDQFSTDGFLTFDTGISDSEIEMLRRTLLTLHETNAGFAEGALFDAIGVDDGKEPRRFPQILHPRSFAPQLVDTQFFRTAQAIAVQLLGGQVRFKADISLLKPANIGAATPWHQDEAFQDPAFEYHELSFWLALQPTDRSNSCMEYLPGSHHGPVLAHGFPGGDSRVHALECVGDFDRAAAIPCPLPAGGCVIHNQRTLHYAGPNLSDRPRQAYVVIFDLVPAPAREFRSFPWRAEHKPARVLREKAWRRRGGLVVHLWRQRSRMRVTSTRTLLFDLRRAIKALRRMVA
ncbi:MAG TPA: phytanoyl-CoA dioxygenase family protein [Acetobacteraceae bacterium]|nr:phytanoyl-CoA dioxygenase family protein [Acetobacteraceae bacterium]